MEMKKILVVGIIFLFIGVSIAPSINFTVVKASNDNDLVEVTTQACGINGYGNTTVKLTRQQYQNLEQYLVEFRARLNKITTREEAVPIFKEAVVELNKYGLLPKGMSVEQAQKLVTGGSQNQNLLKLLEKVYMKNHKEVNTNTVHNLFCLITGETNYTHFLKPIQWLSLTVFRLDGFFWDYMTMYFFQNSPLFPIFALLWFTTTLCAFIFGILYFDIIQIFPGFHTGLNIFFGNHPYLGKYYPAQGWVSTIGIVGKQNISGSFWGQKITGNDISGDGDWNMNYTWRGCVGFTGLILSFGPSAYANYIGTALSVNLGPDRP